MPDLARRGQVSYGFQILECFPGRSAVTVQGTSLSRGRSLPCHGAGHLQYARVVTKVRQSILHGDGQTSAPEPRQIYPARSIPDQPSATFGCLRLGWEQVRNERWDLKISEFLVHQYLSGAVV